MFGEVIHDFEVLGIMGRIISNSDEMMKVVMPPRKHYAFADELIIHCLLFTEK